MPNHTGTHSLIKNIGIKSKKKKIKNKNNVIENDASTPKNNSLAVNNEVPGKPIVTKAVNKLTIHNVGVEAAIPEIKKKSLVWKRLYKHSTKKNSEAVVKL